MAKKNVTDEPLSDCEITDLRSLVSESHGRLTKVETLRLLATVDSLQEKLKSGSGNIDKVFGDMQEQWKAQHKHLLDNEGGYSSEQLKRAENSLREEQFLDLLFLFHSRTVKAGGSAMCVCGAGCGGTVPCGYYATLKSDMDLVRAEWQRLEKRRGDGYAFSPSEVGAHSFLRTIFG